MTPRLLELLFFVYCGLGYLSENIGGTTKVMRTSENRLGFDDRVTSLSITDGYQLVVWEKAYWSGQNTTLEGNVTDLISTWKTEDGSMKCIQKRRGNW